MRRIRRLCAHLGGLMLLARKLAKTMKGLALWFKKVTKNREDHANKVPCARGTRTDILADIRRWIDDISGTSQNFLWLTGDPGCGKPSIAASVVQKYLDRGILPSQLSPTMPPAKPRIPDGTSTPPPTSSFERDVYSLMKLHKIHMNEINHRQSRCLFIQPLQEGSRLDRWRPFVVVIDELDKAESSGLKGTGTIFADLFDESLRHLNVKALISSRLEDTIQQAFTVPRAVLTSPNGSEGLMEVLDTLAAKIDAASEPLQAGRKVRDRSIGLIEPGAIDSGAYAHICRATSRGEVLCLTTLRPNEAMFGHMIKLFAKEATIWSQLSYPNVFPLYGFHLDYKISFVALGLKTGMSGNI
ncbi:hypothetical protein DXG01_015574 [Tephrocybe rancida]|nr:hypothetical protein DXG01_015574 [Tephrocybe rancida]